MFFFLQGLRITREVVYIRLKRNSLEVGHILRRVSRSRLFDLRHRRVLRRILNSIPIVLHYTVEAGQLTADLGGLPQRRRRTDYSPTDAGLRDSSHSSWLVSRHRTDRRK